MALFKKERMQIWVRSLILNVLGVGWPHENYLKKKMLSRSGCLYRGNIVIVMQYNFFTCRVSKRERCYVWSWLTESSAVLHWLFPLTIFPDVSLIKPENSLKPFFMAILWITWIGKLVNSQAGTFQPQNRPTAVCVWKNKLRLHKKKRYIVHASLCMSVHRRLCFIPSCFRWWSKTKRIRKESLREALSRWRCLPFPNPGGSSVAVKSRTEQTESDNVGHALNSWTWQQLCYHPWQPPSLLHSWFTKQTVWNLHSAQTFQYSYQWEISGRNCFPLSQLNATRALRQRNWFVCFLLPRTAFCLLSIETN